MSPRPYDLPIVDGMQSKSRKADKPIVTPRDALQPVFVLVRPQLPENVGMSARAMLNCGMTRMRIVLPGFDWPHQNAYNACSGADQVLREAQVFPTLDAAIADCQAVYATSPRHHDLNLPVVMLADAAAEMAGKLFTLPLREGQNYDSNFGVGIRAETLPPPKMAKPFLTPPRGGSRISVAILFGPERAGLENHEIAMAQKILTIPLQRDFNSLNLSQAVLLTAHALFMELAKAGQAMASNRGQGEAAMTDPPAAQGEFDEFMRRLIGLLDEGGFLFPPEKTPSMIDNLRIMLGRAGLSSQELRTLHGVVTTLVKIEPNRKQ
jgi:tRNA/rRNA methyltransferase